MHVLPEAAGNPHSRQTPSVSQPRGGVQWPGCRAGPASLPRPQAGPARRFSSGRAPRLGQPQHQTPAWSRGEGVEEEGGVCPSWDVAPSDAVAAVISGEQGELLKGDLGPALPGQPGPCWVWTRTQSPLGDGARVGAVAGEPPGSVHSRAHADPMPGPQRREATSGRMTAGGAGGPPVLGLRGAGLRLGARTSRPGLASSTPPALDREQAGHRDTGRRCGV